MNTSISSDHSADRPINTRSEDLLGRATFAEAVARGIIARRGKESFVIGLYGPWGSGKSSVKNMILEKLQEDRSVSPIVVEFNPWQFKDAEQIAQVFFNDIARKIELTDIGTTSEIEANKNRAAKWKQLGSVMSVGGDVVANVAKVASLCGVPFAGLAQALGEAAKTAGKETTQAVTALEAPIARSLSDIKTDLRTAMEELERPILVVLDDIDRLSASEMALIFQMVKVNGDFPNMVYLLLFQRDIVEASLNKIAPKELGADYLEKIIQLGLDLPRVTRGILLELLYSELESVLGETQLSKLRIRTPRNYTDLLTQGGSRYFENVPFLYIETIRDFRRFINSLEFQVGMLTDNNSGDLQANVCDLVALEILRIFEPTVYEAIASNKPLFTCSWERTEDLAPHKERLQRILGLATYRDRVETIIATHFPNLRWAIKGLDRAVGQGIGDAEKARLQAMHPGCFDRYFQLVVPNNELKEADVKRVSSLLGDCNALSNALVELNDAGLLADLIRIWMFRDDLLDTPEKITHAFAGLADATDRMPHPPYGASFWPELCVSQWLNHNSQIPETVSMWVNNSKSVFLPIYVLMVVVTAFQDHNSPHYQIRSRHNAKLLERDFTKKALESLKTAAKSGQLEVNPRRPELIRYWAGIDHKSLINWAKRHFADTSVLVNFLRGFVEPHKEGPVRLVANRAWEMSYHPIRNFMLQRLSKIKHSSLSEEDWKIVEAVWEMLKVAEEQDDRPIHEGSPVKPAEPTPDNIEEQPDENDQDQ